MSARRKRSTGARGPAREPAPPAVAGRQKVGTAERGGADPAPGRPEGRSLVHRALARNTGGKQRHRCILRCRQGGQQVVLLKYESEILAAEQNAIGARQLVHI